MATLQEIIARDELELIAQEIIAQEIAKFKASFSEQVVSKIVANVMLDAKGEKGDSVKGDKGDAPTEQELLSLIKPLIPEPIKGIDGRTPMFVGNNSPKNPQKGDLWYQD